MRVRPAEGPAAPDSVFVEIVNDNYYDARLHAIYEGGMRYPLGTVGGNRRQAAVAIPWQPRPLEVTVTLIIGGGAYVSDRIDVAPGDIVAVRVPPNIASSIFFRRI